MNNKSFEELKELVLEWADDKDLLHSENADVQFMKFIEEVFEFKFELENYKNYQKDWEHIKMPGAFFLEKVKDEMGDIFVTLIILCEDLEIDPVVCLEMAYKKISKRQGKTINGTFVKDEDLNEN
ncbi:MULTISPECIES: MazG-like family protein [Anaerococcus]|uniref:MazG-like family protein n=1 Tax=Anaerococcus TaxID=165779 RepID=UPI001D38F771|nr:MULTISPECIES: MazG-like family protein [Anaerococcus]MBS5989584.1 MazG-like family protein [Anaerococcus hydrogenalis]MDU4026559.1 MazG-like family protein [Anaerococcus sp.]